MLYRDLIPLVKFGSAAGPFLLHRIATGGHLKIARAIPILSGVTAVAVAIMTAAPALAGPVSPAQPRAAHPRIVRSILRTGTIVTGVRGSGGRGVVLTGTYVGSPGTGCGVTG